MKLIAIGEEFNEYEIKDLKKERPDVVIYNYETGSYDGSGFLIARKGNKWAYQDLGHCSCNGPLEGFYGSVFDFSLDDIMKIVDNHDPYSKGYSLPVMNEVKRRRFR